MFGPLPDGRVLSQAVDQVVQTYADQGFGAAMARFIALVMQQGELTDSFLDAPAPDPAQFGMPAQDDGSRTEPLFRNMPAINAYEPDVETLKTLGRQVVLAVGENSGETMAARAARAVAALLRTQAVTFPGDLSGYVGEVHGQLMGQPQEFADRLREILA